MGKPLYECVRKMVQQGTLPVKEVWSMIQHRLKNSLVRLQINVLMPRVLPLCSCGCGEKVWWYKGHVDRFHNLYPGMPMVSLKGHIGASIVRVKEQYKVDTKTGCWVWQMHLRDGYGILKRGESCNSAHRFFYEKYKGPIPEGLVLDHLCNNRACVNPDHLEPVTSQENSKRRFSRPKQKEDWLSFVSEC